MKIRNTTLDSIPVLIIEGSLSAEVIIQLEKEIERHLQNPPDLVLDLSLVTFIDSAALGSFLRYVSMFRKRNRQLLFAGVNAQLMEVFRLTGVTDQITLYDTPQSAVESLHGK